MFKPRRVLAGLNELPASRPDRRRSSFTPRGFASETAIGRKTIGQPTRKIVMQFATRIRMIVSFREGAFPQSERGSVGRFCTLCGKSRCALMVGSHHGYSCRYGSFDDPPNRLSSQTSSCGCYPGRRDVGLVAISVPSTDAQRTSFASVIVEALREMTLE